MHSMSFILVVDWPTETVLIDSSLLLAPRSLQSIRRLQSRLALRLRLVVLQTCQMNSGLDSEVFLSEIWSVLDFQSELFPGAECLI